MRSTGANVLVAIFSEQESQAAYLLRKHEVSRLECAIYLHGTRKDEPTISDPAASQTAKNKLVGERMEFHDEPESASARGYGIDH